MSSLRNIVAAAAALAIASSGAAGQTKPREAPRQASVASAPGSRTTFSKSRQIELILSTAPREISEHATHYVLGPAGYTKERAGTNDFHCLVEHQFLDTYEPVCYDREGAETTLQSRLYREELRASGEGEEEVARRVAEAYGTGRLRAPRRPGFAYMMAPDQFVYDEHTGNKFQGPPHLMFYAPYATMADVGGFVGLHAPIVIFEGQPDAFIVVIPSAMASHGGAPGGRP